MDNFERSVEVSCKGENTRQDYTGMFTFKLFLTNKEQMELNRELRNKVGDLSTIAASWNFKGYVEAIKNIAPTEGDNPIVINDNAKNLVLAYINHFLPNIPPSANVISNGVILSKYIVSAPDWWKNSNNGENLMDDEPITELLKQLKLLRDSFLDDNENQS